MSFHWTCPYCDRDTTITDSHQENNFILNLDNADGHRMFQSSVVVCPNPKCRKFTFRLFMHEAEWSNVVANRSVGKLIRAWSLLVKDWYVLRHDREERLKNIVLVAKAKDDAKSGSTSVAPPKSHRRIWGVSSGQIWGLTGRAPVSSRR